MERDLLRNQVSDALGGRRLVYSGLRGDDAEPLADLPQFHAAFSMVSAYRRRSGVEAMAHEDLTRARPDLELYDIDDHLDEAAAREFRHAHLRALDAPSALVPYRASQFLSSIGFARRDRCVMLGMFGGQHAAFEHKPWVETSLQRLGIDIVPWTYVADEEQFAVIERLHDGPLVLRRSRTSGGEGFQVLTEPDQLDAVWPRLPEAFVAVAPYLEGAVPLNVGATVWRDGVTVHHPSVQLVGIAECVTRQFGYCGNDFAAAASLDGAVVDAIEATTTTIGRWLRSNGYLGSFGVDFLLHRGRLLFTEVNARFQGSTIASSRLAIEAGEGCLVLEHLAAHLGLAAPPQRPLRGLLAEAKPLAHFILHWTGTGPANIDPEALIRSFGAAAQVDVLTNRGLSTAIGAVVSRTTVREQITDTGYNLREPWRSALSDWQRATVSTVLERTPHA